MKKVYFIRIIVFISTILVFISVFLFLGKKQINEHRLQWWLSAINWESQERKYTGKNIKIAVIDSGIDTEHKDLQKNNIKTVVSGESNSSLSHGTGIAGIICASPSNKDGVLGVAPNAEIVSFSVTDDSNNIDINSVISSIQTSVKADVDIINISCGLSGYSKKLEDEINAAFRKGIIIVASAGNFMENEMLYPAAFDNVLAVGSMDKNGKIVSPTGQLNKNVIYLPGENIVTTAPNNSYNSMFGSSPATAILSGIIAIILEAKPDLTNTEIYKYFNLQKSNNINVKKIINEIGG